MARRKKNHISSQEFLADIKRVSPYIVNHLSAILKRFSFFFGFIAFLIGNTAFVQFLLKLKLIPFLRLRPSASVCFILLGIAVLLLAIQKRHSIIKFAITFLSVITILLTAICLLSFVTYIQHLVYPHIPQFSPENLNFFFHMAPNAAIIFLLLGISTLLAPYKRTILHSQIFALFALLLLLPINIGTLYGTQFIYSVSTSTQLALCATIGLNALIAALLSSRPDSGLMVTITNVHAGGFLARRFLAGAVVIPIVIGWMVYIGYHLSLYDSQSRFLLVISVTMVTFIIFSYFLARSFYALDLKRRQTEGNVLFLSEASKILSSSLDYRKSIRQTVAFTVQHIASMCCVEFISPKGKLQLVALAHEDPNKVKQALKFRKVILAKIQNQSGGLQSTKSVYYPIISDEMLQGWAQRKKELQLLRQLHLYSGIIVPIISQGKTVGIMSFFSSYTHVYSPADVHMAEELATRIGLVIENAKLYKNAQEAIKLRDEFLSIASHELRTPLTSLKVYTEVLERTFNNKDLKTATYLQKMDVQITSITNLIHDLLDVTRIQSGKLSFNFETFSFENIVKEVVENFQLTALHHKIQITGTADIPILADRERLSQVILNLLTNAVKYSPHANKVEVTLAKTHSGVSFSVRDFGIGIDKKNLGKVFDRFYQVGNKKQINSGLGMGLYISKEIITRHNGAINARSVKGKGSIFTFSLPIEKKES